MEKLELYELSERDDDGRQKIGIVGMFKDLDVAEKVKDGLFQTINKVELIIYDTYEEYIKERNNKIKIKALCKLTSEEKKVLGLV
ncbi:MAG: hypothetical protein PHR68_04585 [Candidatus Gracilibacteria bacterium]|nr:hypothetical protein [Candidatus Gracilibacteria bacterium]